MKNISYSLEYESRKDSTWLLVPFGDMHVGHKTFDEDEYYKTIDYIAEHDNCRTILMGDYGECISAKDPRHDYNAIDFELATPDKQFRKVKEDLMPIKDKIICVLHGNHGYNFWKRHNHNYVDNLAYDLGSVYTGISAYIRLKFIRRSGTSRQINNFDIYAHHGWTSARTSGYKVKVIHDLANIFPMLNLYLMGHTHEKGEVFPQVKLFVDDAMRTRQWVSKFVYSGSYMKGYEDGVMGSYAEMRAYTPLHLGSPVIEIKPNRTDGRNETNVPPFSVRTFDID